MHGVNIFHPCSCADMYRKKLDTKEYEMIELGNKMTLIYPRELRAEIKQLMQISQRELIQN